MGQIVELNRRIKGYVPKGRSYQKNYQNITALYRLLIFKKIEYINKIFPYLLPTENNIN